MCNARMSGAPTRSDPLALASLACSLLWLFGLGTLAAIALGHLSLRRIQKSNGYLKGAGSARASLTVAYATVASVVFLLIAVEVIA